MASPKSNGITIDIQKTLEATFNHSEEIDFDRSFIRAQKVWERTSDQIQTVLGSEIYNQWFKNLNPLLVIENGLLLECATDFQVRWLNTNYRELVDVLLSCQDKSLSCFFISKKDRMRIDC